MTYRVYTGPPGAKEISAEEKARWLYQEFGFLDDAIGWARHVNSTRRVTLLIEGDNGVGLGRSEVTAAVKRLEHDAGLAREVN